MSPADTDRSLWAALRRIQGRQDEPQAVRERRDDSSHAFWATAAADRAEREHRYDDARRARKHAQDAHERREAHDAKLIKVQAPPRPRARGAGRPAGRRRATTSTSASAQDPPPGSSSPPSPRRHPITFGEQER